MATATGQHGRAKLDGINNASAETGRTCLGWKPTCRPMIVSTPTVYFLIPFSWAPTSFFRCCPEGEIERESEDGGGGGQRPSVSNDHMEPLNFYDNSH